MSDEITIIGAGIGGLACALSLHDAGFAVRVYEAAPQLAPLGVGINLLPHAVRELAELGLLPALEASGHACRELAYYTKRGERIWAEPRGRAAGYDWPQISIHRGTLQMLLLEAVRARLGDDRVRLGHCLVGIDSNTNSARLHFAKAPGQPPFEHVDASLMVAADGIHSVARQQQRPDEGPPKWNGAVMWRGVAEAAPYLDGHTMVMCGHAAQKFVCYPIGAAANGTQLTNFVAELRFDPAQPFDRADWNKPGVLADFLPRFADWQFDWLDVPTLIRSAPATWTYPMVDRDPLPRWRDGRVTLLGDAAHPMYPIGSNGASQAILDARVLTGCIRHHGPATAALDRYEAIRREATAAIVLANRGQGPEAAMQLVEERAPNGYARLHDVISETELAEIAERYKRLAGFSIAELSSRPSLAAPTP